MRLLQFFKAVFILKRSFGENQYNSVNIPKGDTFLVKTVPISIFPASFNLK